MTDLSPSFSEYAPASISSSLPTSDAKILESAAHEVTLQTLNANAIILAHALSDKAINWEIHNCKIIQKNITQDETLPFLYHYDRLDDSMKQAHPLTPKLLAQFNTPMTATEAATFIGTDSKMCAQPWHVKVTGSLVVFSEALQLAVHLQWTNTSKNTQHLYTKTVEEALTAAIKDWQFFGRVYVLYKNSKQTLVSIDDNEQVLSLIANPNYQPLAATHALTLIAKLEANKTELPWFERAILERLQ